MFIENKTLKMYGFPDILKRQNDAINNYADISPGSSSLLQDLGFEDFLMQGVKKNLPFVRYPPRKVCPALFYHRTRKHQVRGLDQFQLTI